MAPSTQKALVIPEPKQPWKLLTDWPVQTPGPKHVLIKIVAAALNPADWKTQVYALPFITDYPVVGGADGAGIIEEVGSEVTNVAKGEKVLFPGGGVFDKTQATFMQYTVVPADFVAKIPDNISFDEAASVPLTLNTVLTGLWSHHPQASSVDFAAPWEEGGLTKYVGQAALVIGGSSSVGQFAIQIAKLQGFSPIITTSSLKHTDFLKTLGATHVLDRSLAPEAILAELPTLTAGKPLVYAYNAIDEDTLHHLAYDALAPGGALVVVDPQTSTLDAKIARDKEAGLAPKKIAKTFAAIGLPQNYAMGVELYKRLTEWLRTGVIVPNRIEVLPGGLAGIPEGCDRMRDNKVSGIKLIVRPQETA
ncbi:GroES-like protein [Daedaleopsis nitida]|nr:GroES-like protein [Daedaleopsis nitida]